MLMGDKTMFGVLELGRYTRDEIENIILIKILSLSSPFCLVFPKHSDRLNKFVQIVTLKALTHDDLRRIFKR